MIRLLWVFDKNACSEACAVPILVRPINREIYYKEIGTAMPSPSLAKLAARSRAVTLPPTTPSIDMLTAFADDDGLIRFIADTSHKCSNWYVESIGNFREVRKTDISSPDFYRGIVRTIHFNQIGELLLTAPESSAELFASHAEWFLKRRIHDKKSHGLLYLCQRTIYNNPS